MSKDERSPINLWLAGAHTKNAFGSASVVFTIRREMTDQSGKIQAGMFGVFAKQAITQTTQSALSSKIVGSSMTTEIFDLPQVGEQIYAHVIPSINDMAVNIFNVQQRLIARVVFT